MAFFRDWRRRQHKTEEDRTRSEERLRAFMDSTPEALLESLGSRTDGLTALEAEERLEQYGPNEITTGSKDSIAHHLREALINPFNAVLFAVALITLLTDVVFSERADFLTVGIILALILLSGLISFIQNRRSHAAASQLASMISNRTDVLRAGEMVEIAFTDVVPGDLIRLSAGDMVPADVRFLQTKDTFVGQSSLTGESLPVEKFADSESRTDLALTDLTALGFMGTNIVSGSALALALQTGNDTVLGSMAQTLAGDRATSSFERGVDAVSRLLIRFTLVMVPIVFLVNGLTKGDWVNALLFAITVAVGLTPELLPMILTSTLARGAVSMSRRSVIVKKLGAIQTFGEMDVLCTDKTGTLTEDRIVLEKYLNVLGEDDLRVLRHAFLNSAFQTGLKNLIDHAILKRGRNEGLEAVLEPYTRIDEIPFDFTRRRMSVVLEDQTGKRQLITKGAVEEMVEVSSFVEWKGEVLPLDPTLKERVLAVYERFNREGLRMLAVAQKNEVPDQNEFSVADESRLVLIGFVGFLDPPKESAAAAITALREHGVRTVVLTGDSEGVAIKVCGRVGVKTEGYLTGSDVAALDHDGLLLAVRTTDLFAKLSPDEKKRVVAAFQENGHTVGYMGDGINDALPLHQADVGISVDNAVDIAKETADIILLKKDLMVLEEGVIEGRRTFGNIVKYIKMAASGNFGNMISVMVASIFLPFLPLLPVQILTQNLLTDFSQLGIPFDRVDEEYLAQPRKWETGSIRSFMAFFGPLSSIFDILCFLVLWYGLGANRPEMAPLFHAGWFVFGTVSQILVIHAIRTSKKPFLESRPSPALFASTLIVALVTLVVGFSGAARAIDMAKLPLLYVPWLVLLLAGYWITAQLSKRLYVRRFGSWL